MHVSQRALSSSKTPPRILQRSLSSSTPSSLACHCLLRCCCCRLCCSQLLCTISATLRCMVKLCLQRSRTLLSSGSRLLRLLQLRLRL
jgi:hypothetical protein